MQIVCRVTLDADEYAATRAHLKMKRPAVCPHCKAKRSLSILGVYARSSTAKDSNKAIVIQVRRFVCGSCRKTVSLLPSFAQPYRLVCSLTIERFFNDGASTVDTIGWRHLLRRYWQRFTQWLPRLLKAIGRVIGLPPPGQAPQGSWHAIVAAYGRLDRATRTLVQDFQVTLFGKYRCHQPIRPEGEA